LKADVPQEMDVFELDGHRRLLLELAPELQ
jgi:hypothetical protein